LLDRQRFKRSLPDLFLMSLAALVACLPLAWFFLHFPEEFSAPLNRVSILGGWMKNTVQITGIPAWRIIVDQIRLGLLGYTHIPLKVYYAPGVPLLRPVSAALFLLGLGLLFIRPRDPRTWLMFLWVMAFGLLTAFSESAPAAQRYVAVAPAAALLVGYALSETILLMQRIWPRFRLVILMVGLLMVGWIAFDEVNFYFFDYTPRSDFGGDHSQIAQDLAFYLQDKDDSWKVYFFGPPFMGYQSIASLPFLAPHIEGLNMDFPWGSPDNPVPEGTHLIFAFLNHRQDDLAAIQAAFPGGKLRKIYTSGDRLLYQIYEVSPDS